MLTSGGCQPSLMLRQPLCLSPSSDPAKFAFAFFLPAFREGRFKKKKRTWISETVSKHLVSAAVNKLRFAGMASLVGGGQLISGITLWWKRRKKYFIWCGSALPCQQLMYSLCVCEASGFRGQVKSGWRFLILVFLQGNCNTAALHFTLLRVQGFFFLYGAASTADSCCFAHAAGWGAWGSRGEVGKKACRGFILIGLSQLQLTSFSKEISTVWQFSVNKCC